MYILKSTFGLFIMFSFVISATVFAQASLTSDHCADFLEVLEDAQNNWNKYKGDFVSKDDYYSISKYNKYIWDSREPEHLTELMFGMTWVEFNMCSTYDLEEAQACYKTYLRTMKNCLPDGYELTSEENDYAIQFNEFNVKSDWSDGGDAPSVDIALKQKDDWYYVLITVSTSLF
jgi:hypothetical protein